MTQIMIRLLLADDNALCRAGVRALIDAMPDVDVVSEVSDGAAALRAIEELRPDVALLSLSTPGLDGPEVARRADGEPQATRAILMNAEDDDVRRARAEGVAGVLLTTAGRAELEHAVRAVARGKTWFAPDVGRLRAPAGRRSLSPPPAAPVPLTPRLRETLQLLVEGLSSKEIAHRLDLSTRTVEKHRATLMERLGIRTVAGLVQYAMRAGIARSAP
jgi:DNA-binding NarL/FixJ family response regulator